MEWFEVIIYGWLCLFGACIGSFINVIVYRLPRKESIAKGRSRCPKCGHQLRWYDLIPILSWLILKGKCRDCKDKISGRYPLVEWLCAVSAMVCYTRWQFDWQVPLVFGVSVILLAISLIDAETQEIPNGLIIALIPFAVAAIFAIPDVSLLSRGIGLVIVSLPMVLLTAFIGNAFGGGDMKLMAVCGFLLGWQNTLLAFFFALLIGGSYGGYLLATEKAEKGTLIAFGPALCIGIVIAMFYGNQMVGLYLQLFGL